MHGVGQLLGFLLFVIPAIAWKWVKTWWSGNNGQRHSTNHAAILTEKVQTRQSHAFRACLARRVEPDDSGNAAVSRKGLTVTKYVRFGREKDMSESCNNGCLAAPEATRCLVADHGFSEEQVQAHAAAGLQPGQLLQLLLKFGKAVLPLLPVIIPFLSGGGDINALVAAIQQMIDAAQK